MATIQITDLNTTVEYAELSDLELEAVVGGKGGSVQVGGRVEVGDKEVIETGVGVDINLKPFPWS